MLGPFDYVLAILSFLAEIYVVVRLCTLKHAVRYSALSFYMLSAIGATIAQEVALSRYGVSSSAYGFAYYYSDALLTISLFFVVMSFYHQVFQQMGAGKHVRLASVLLLSGTAVVSLIMVMSNRAHFTATSFVVEMGQNLYFVGVVLTYLLWIAVVKLKETRTRLIQLVLALGIYFSANAACYALRNLFPRLQGEFLQYIPPVIGTFLPLAWAFTFTKVPEDARLETARVASARLAADPS